VEYAVKERSLAAPSFMSRLLRPVRRSDRRPMRVYVPARFSLEDLCLAANGHAYGSTHQR
jgi:hypothetical protein